MGSDKVDSMDAIYKRMADEISAQIDKEIIEAIYKHIPDGYFEYDANKQKIDTEYLFSVKRKVEQLLKAIIEKYNLGEYISIKYRYRLDEDKWDNSKYHELYKQRKDINSKILRSGYEYVPVDFEDWTRTYLSDYTITAGIYSDMCDSRRIIKEDLVTLNKIAKRYIKTT